jgi:hypothetical protein
MPDSSALRVPPQLVTKVPIDSGTYIYNLRSPYKNLEALRGNYIDFKKGAIKAVEGRNRRAMA